MLWRGLAKAHHITRRQLAHMVKHTNKENTHAKGNIYTGLHHARCTTRHHTEHAYRATALQSLKHRPDKDYLLICINSEKLSHMNLALLYFVLVFIFTLFIINENVTLSCKCAYVCVSVCEFMFFLCPY